jgi:3-deoxy-7-phosphoheptulonate synthase
MENNGTVDTRIKKYEPIQSPHQVQLDVPRTQRAYATVINGRRTIENILDRKDPRKVIVLGPCSIHDPQMAEDYARRLKDLSDQVEDRFFLVMRTYFEKPRTTTGWAGLQNDPDMDGSNDINKGLHEARKILLNNAALGIPSGTEYLDTMSPQYTSDLISWAAIGARTTESQQHRNLVSGLSMPAGFKNGTHGHVDVAINAILRARGPHSFFGINPYGVFSQINTAGNPYSHIILRGGDEPNYSAECVQAIQARLRAKGLPDNVVIDCSHGNSQKDFNRQPVVFAEVVKQISDGNAGIVGMMLESNLHGSNQQIPADLKGFDKASLAYGVSVTDACISWETTFEIIQEAYRSR